MNNKSKYSHIKSFKDFEAEKFQLYYSIRVAKKKLELTIFNIRTYFSLEKVLYNLLLTNVVDPVFMSLRNMVYDWFHKLKRGVTGRSGKKKREKIK